PRPLVPGPGGDAHPGVRGRQQDGVVRGQLRDLRDPASAAARLGGRDTQTTQVQEADPVDGAKRFWTQTMMELQDVTKVYQQGRRIVEAVRGVSLRIGPGEFVSIMGPSGSGKSTLMHLLGALDTPTSGAALFDGRDLRTLSDRERSRL